MFEFSVFCCSGGLDVGGLHKISAVLITVFWQVVMIQPRGAAPGGQWQGLVCLCFEQTGTGMPQLDSGFLVEIDNRRIGRGGASGNRVCAARALSVIRFCGR